MDRPQPKFEMGQQVFDQSGFLAGTVEHVYYNEHTGVYHYTLSGQTYGRFNYCAETDLNPNIRIQS